VSPGRIEMRESKRRGLISDQGYARRHGNSDRCKKKREKGRRRSEVVVGKQMREKTSDSVEVVDETLKYTRAPLPKNTFF
jgi:hypothetical protein